MVWTLHESLWHNGTVLVIEQVWIRAFEWCVIYSDYRVSPSLNTQSCNRRPLCSTFKFENLRSPKKKRFLPKNYFFKNCFLKTLTSFFFAPENMKRPPSKVAHNRPRSFFFSTGLAAQTAQKQKSSTTKSPLMQDWVFRLG